MLETLAKDLSVVMRSLRRTPFFSLAVVVTLALGIGGTSTMFTGVNAMLRDLPFPRPDRLVALWQSDRESGRIPVAMPTMLDWQQQSRTLDHLAVAATSAVNVNGGAEPERIKAAYVTEGFFATLGVFPLRGRGFSHDETVAGGPQIAVISHGLWQRLYGRDPAVLDRKLSIEGVGFRIIGVMPGGFLYPEGADIWLPLDTNDGSDRSAHNYPVVARLKPGVTLEQARADMSALAARLAEAYPDADRGLGVAVVPLREDLLGSTAKILFLLFGAVAFVLLIACANVANLLFARALERQGETALRVVLGARPAALLRPFLVESLTLALLGGALGLAFAATGLGILTRLAPPEVLDPAGFRIDGPVLLFTFGVSLLSGLACGVVPALRASRHRDLRGTLAAAGSRSTTAGRRGMNALTAAEVAIAFVLLAGAGILIRSTQRLSEVDPGFRLDGVALAKFSMSGLEGSRHSDRAWRSAFFTQVAERARELPGVRAVGLVSQPPLAERSFNGMLTVEGWSGNGHATGPDAYYRLAGGDYFSVLGIQVLQGRGLTAADREGAPQVAVVNEQLAHRIAPDGAILGRRVKAPNMDGIDGWAAVVGVIADVRTLGLGREPRPEIYFPYAQRPTRTWEMTLALRTDHPREAVRPLREVVRSLDPGLPFRFETIRDAVDAALAQTRFRSLLLSLFAGTALLLATVGVFGVVSYVAAQRDREVGIRMALGADRPSVQALVLRGGMAPVLAGIACGLLAALALTRLLSSLVYAVSVRDPVTFGTVVVLLCASALVAAYLPARRATRVDPMQVLREQ
jgi:putative ABC transport system permease protein